MSVPVTILGAGPAGLAVACHANRSGIPFRLYERSDEIGGLCRTFRCGAHSYDAGAHRVHDRDPEITRDLKELLGDRLVPVRAPSQIYLDGRFVDFPPTPLNFVFSFGPGDVGRILLDLARNRVASRNIESFADFATHNFGKILAERFLLGYSQKVWGLPADALSPDISTRRLRGMTFRALLREAFGSGRGSAHLDGGFLYPDGGFGRIVEALSRDLPDGSVRTRHEVVGIECEREFVRRIHFSGRPPVETAGAVVSTIPLTELVGLLGDRVTRGAHEAAAALRFRSVRLVFLRLAEPRLGPNASLYFPDPALCFSRISEPKNRSPSMSPPLETSLVVEVPCFSEEPLGRLPVEALVERIVDEIAGTGLVDRAKVVEWRHHHLPDAYPVYSVDYARRVEAIVGSLRGIENLECLGRNGRFRYGHLHDQLRMGKDYVSRLSL